MSFRLEFWDYIISIIILIIILCYICSTSLTSNIAYFKNKITGGGRVNYKEYPLKDCFYYLPMANFEDEIYGYGDSYKETLNTCVPCDHCGKMFTLRALKDGECSECFMVRCFLNPDLWEKCHCKLSDPHHCWTQLGKLEHSDMYIENGKTVCTCPLCL